MCKIRHLVILGLALVLGILSSLSADRYSDWKESLAPDRETKDMLVVHNDYIAVQLDDEDGQFNIGTWPDDITLTYAYPSSPWSSWVVIKVDDTPYTMDPSGGHGAWTDPPDSMPVTDDFDIVPHSGDSTYIEGGWEIGEVEVIQKLMPVYIYNSSDTTGTIFIHYTITNNDDVAHTVGVCLQMDTMIDWNDAAPLSTAYGYSAVEQDYYGPDGMPAYWTACTDPPPPAPSVVCAQGYLIGYDAVPPDRFAVGAWGSFYNVTWDYTVSGTPYGDSSVLLWWYEILLAPGESWEVATYYGLGLPEEVQPEVTIIEPDSFSYSTCPAQQAIIRIYDDSGVREETIMLNVNGLTYTVSDPQLEWIPPYLYFTPGIDFGNGDTVEVILVHAEDFFGNDIASVDWQFYIDLEGPYIFDNTPPEGALLWDTLTPVSFRITDDLTGLNEMSVLIDIKGLLTADYTGTFNIFSPAVNWDGELLTFYPESMGVAFTLDDTVTVKVVRAEDTPDYCEPNSIAEPSSFYFVMGDDDTLPPVFSNYFVTHWPDEDPFYIECDITDPSGVYDDLTDISGQGVYLIWDNDGDVSVSDYEGIVQLENTVGDRFRTVTTIGVQPEGTEFVYIVRAYDNDFEYSNQSDRTEGFSPMQSVVKVTLAVPYQDVYSSCPDQNISIFIDNLNGVIGDSLTLTVQGVTYNVASSGELDYSDSYLNFNPSSTLSEGLVEFELTKIYDLIYTAAPASQFWSFYIDLTPPVIWEQVPEPESEIGLSDFEIRFRLADSLSGLDLSSVQIIIGDRFLRLDSTGVNWNGELVTISTADANLQFADGVGITVQVIAEDMCDASFCPRNVLDTSWQFYTGSNVCSRSPNPITPNNDLKNDYVTFTFPNMVFKAPDSEILLFSLDGNLVRELKEADRVSDKWVWDGNDNGGQPVKQGVYIYIIKSDDNVICNGTVTVVR
ncbi:gliding motility-associated C-terminal domain-containing protein [bacterium]|nr:gliding motility-associated C-terminal domain-containing protein [bacterium]